MKDVSSYYATSDKKASNYLRTNNMKLINFDLIAYHNIYPN